MILIYNDKKIKGKIMKKIIFLFCALGLLAAAPSTRNVLTTYGSGLYETMPDTVIISMGVQGEGLTADDAQKALRKTLTAVMDSLKPLDLPAEQLRTDSYSLYPVYKKGFTGYTTSNIERYRAYIRLSIELRQIQQMGRAVDTAIKGGAHRVENIEYKLHDENPAKQAALKLAIENARNKANFMADSFEVKLLSPVFIEEVASGYYMPRKVAGINSLAVMREREDAESHFEPPEGKIGFNARVNVTYEIEALPAKSE